MDAPELVLVMRCRKAVTYGLHVLLGTVVRTGRPLDDFRGFSLRWDRFNALEITRGCVSPARTNPNHVQASEAQSHGPR